MLFSRISTLGLSCDTEAQSLLDAAVRAVTPVMNARRWKVGHLTEFLPRSDRLLGVNVNRGMTIKIRLRHSKTSTTLFAFEAVVETLLHELVHNTFGPHDRHFYSLLDKVKDETERSLTSSIPYALTGVLPPRLTGGVKLGGSKRPRTKTQRELCLEAAERRVNDGFSCALDEAEALPAASSVSSYSDHVVEEEFEVLSVVIVIE